MPRGILVRTEIDAPPSRVWAVLEPIERHVEWMADADAIRFTGDSRRGVGTTFVCDTKIGPIRLADHMEITEWEPDRTMGVRHTGIVSGVGRFRLEPIDLGRRTRFTWVEALHFPWWLGGNVGAAIGGKLVLAPLWRRNLRALRRVVEMPA